MIDELDETDRTDSRFYYRVEDQSYLPEMAGEECPPVGSPPPLALGIIFAESHLFDMSNRTDSLLPAGVPRYVRCYDNGGVDRGGSIDRYTIVFTGRYRHKTCGEISYLAMNAAPLHPQGFGQHGSSKHPIDTNRHGFAPALGRKNHLGKRISFTELPADCRALALRVYRELWGLSAPDEMKRAA